MLRKSEDKRDESGNESRGNGGKREGEEGEKGEIETFSGELGGELEGPIPL